MFPLIFAYAKKISDVLLVCASNLIEARFYVAKFYCNLCANNFFLCPILLNRQCAQNRTT